MFKRGKFNLESFLHCGRIIIPMIQRDYAQGRQDKKVTAIREKFLKDIISCLCGEKPSLELDFVFGAFDENEKAVLPIDGQQRLTTLCLVYWYFGKLPTKAVDMENPNSRDLLSYGARRIASRFVSGLLESDAKYDWKAADIKSPEKWIMEQTWFRPVWKRDATVSGMLTTLRTLHAIVTSRKAGLFDDVKLPDPERLKNITFYFDPMDKVNADEGYRKMNARGRALSDWENIRSVVEEGVYKESFDPHLRDHWMKSISGEWVSAMESYLPESDYGLRAAKMDGDIAKCDTAVDEYLDEQTDRFNEGFRNLLDLSVYLYAVRNIGDLKDHYLAIARQINCENQMDYTPLERLFDERVASWGIANTHDADALTSVILCGKVVPKKDMERSRIVVKGDGDEPWRDEVWKRLIPFVLSYYEKLFRQHNASPVDYERWIVPGVIESAVDFYDALRHSGDGQIRGWDPLDRAWCIAAGWKSEAMRDKNWFWSRLKDKNATCDFSNFRKDVLFVRSDSQKQAFDNVTAVRFYVMAKVLSQKLEPNREFAVRHLYNLLDNQDSISVEALGKTLEFVDRLFDSQISAAKDGLNEQEQCLRNYRNEVFHGCKIQMDEEIVKSMCNQRGDFSYLEYEKEYSKLNGTIGFLTNSQRSGFDEKLYDSFDKVVWREGMLPRQAFFEVVRASSKSNFRPTNAEKLRIPSEDGNVVQWKYNFISPLWRRIFADYVAGIDKDLLPEIAFMLNADDSIFNGMSYLWRHLSDGRLYLNKTDGKLCTYVWLTYADRARAILDAVGIPFVASWSATRYPLESLGCAGCFMDISPALNNCLDADIRLYNEKNDKPWTKKMKVRNLNAVVEEIKSEIDACQSDVCGVEE